MPRPRSLSPERLAGAAVAVLDREGAAGLSMRAVAAELRMSTMGLYRYVADRDELERVVIDFLLAQLDVEVPADLPWDERIGELAHRARDAVWRHPAAVPLLLSRRQDSVASMRWGEAVLGVLAEAGFDAVERMIAFRALLSYLLGSLQVQSLGPLDGPGTRTLAELPVDRYPALARTAREAGRLDAAAEFGGGLGIFLRGLRK